MNQFAESSELRRAISVLEMVGDLYQKLRVGSTCRGSRMTAAMLVLALLSTTNPRVPTIASYHNRSQQHLHPLSLLPWTVENHFAS
jgi:hypothetical protein